MSVPSATDGAGGGAPAGEPEPGRERPRVPGLLPVDVEHDGLAGAICVYLVEAPEPTLVDPGPSTSLPALIDGLEAHGVGLFDIRRVLLTHVHLDHAGAAGHLARDNPRLAVHVHEAGAAHLADPERLVASTRRTFGEAHDRLWGEVLPLPEDRLHGWRPGDPAPVPGMRPIPTPGHIAHHLAWEAERLGVLLTGDSLGILLDPRGPSHPATPPPAVDLAAWYHTLDAVLAPVEVDAFGPTHFGLHRDLHGRRRRLRERLGALAARVRRAMEGGPEAEAADREAFHRETLELHAASVPRARAERYFGTFSARTDWDGMRFHCARAPVARSPAAEPAEDPGPA